MLVRSSLIYSLVRGGAGGGSNPLLRGSDKYACTGIPDRRLPLR